MEGSLQEIEKLKTIIYKITREESLSEKERAEIDKIIEAKDYKEPISE